MIVVCEQGAIADPLLKTENKHINISGDSTPQNLELGTSRIKVEHLIETAVSNKHTLCKVVSKFPRLPCLLCDVRSKECASRVH
jgi:hypothetical protein